MFCENCGFELLEDGRFCGQCGTPRQSAGSPRTVLASARGRLSRLAGTQQLQGFSLKEMFSEVLKRRSREELDDYFIVGTYRTTPKIEEVQTGWPKPWFFARVLAFVTVVYVGFSFALSFFPNPNLIPGLIMMGSLAMPLATLFLFFELNTPHNVSFAQVLMLLCFGGILSVIISLIGFDVSDLSWLGASQAGIIEEVGKIAAVFLILRKRSYPYVLNGLLFGAAVGAGFAAFESAGYAFRALFLGRHAMSSLILLRGLMAPFAHVAWTAISAGALWRVKGNHGLSFKMFLEPQFLRTFSIPVVLHMLWNSPLPSPFFLIPIVVGIMGWYVIFGLVQQGLQQIKREQDIAKPPTPELAHTQATSS